MIVTIETGSTCYGTNPVYSYYSLNKWLGTSIGSESVRLEQMQAIAQWIGLRVGSEVDAEAIRRKRGELRAGGSYVIYGRYGIFLWAMSGYF